MHHAGNVTRSFAAAILSTAALSTSLLACTTSQARTSRTPTLADVQLIDRDSGERLPIYTHQGEYWVAGRPGANYAVDIRNRSSGRILAVISVDGVNALTGKTAAAKPDDGYVLNAYQQWAITGWRKSSSEVAAFYFAENSDSYASRTGRPSEVGVIGVALFREKTAPPSPTAQVTPAPAPLPRTARRSPSHESAGAAQDMAAPSAPVSAEASSAKSTAANTTASASKDTAPSLGTGHGAREASHTTTTQFDSASQAPAQIMRIRYDSFDKLVALGVIPRPQPVHSPNPFPASARSYVPDPPRY